MVSRSSRLITGCIAGCITGAMTGCMAIGAGAMEGAIGDGRSEAGGPVVREKSKPSKPVRSWFY